MKIQYWIAQTLLAIFITVIASQAHAIVIEAEEYMEGGEGLAFHDSTPGNQGNTDLKPDGDVDIWEVEGITKIGSTTKGEWVRWKVDFPKAGEYTFKFHVATQDENTTFALVAFGERTVINVPNTGGYNTFKVVEKKINIPGAGYKAFQIKFLDNPMDIDKFEITGQGIKDPDAPLDYALYMATTDKKAKVSWIPSENAEFYELTWHNIEKETTSEIISTTEPFKVFEFPYPGHFTFSIRSCRMVEAEKKEGEEATEKEKECSDWASSIDPEYSIVNGKEKSWYLYGYLNTTDHIETVDHPGHVDIVEHPGHVETIKQPPKTDFKPLINGLENMLDMVKGMQDGA